MRFHSFPLLLVLLISTFYLVSPAQAVDEIDRLIEKHLSQPSVANADRTWLTPEVRPIVIDRLTRRLDDKNPDVVRGSTHALIAMGHRETLLKYAKLLEDQPRSANPLEAMIATEEAIPILMPIALEGSNLKPVPAPEDDVIFNSPRQRAATIIFHILKDRHVFPKPTRQWALNTWHLAGQDPTLQALRDWWTHNRSALLAARYPDATWLPPATEDESPLNDEHVPKKSPLPQHRLNSSGLL